jgi:2-dehydropantoate 2-reductase
VSAPRIAIAGAGGLGCYLGVVLARAGAQVRLLARGAHAAALVHGLVLQDASGITRVPLPVADTADEAALADLAGFGWIVFAAKSQHTGALARQLAPHAGPHAHIASVQNGVDNEAVLADAFGRPVAGGLCRGFYAHLTGPGALQVGGSTFEAVLGDYPTGCGAATQALADLLGAGGMAAATSPDIRRAKWLKLALNNAINLPSALVGADSRRLLGDADYAWVVRNLVREAAAAAAADEVEFSAQELDALLAFLRGLEPIVSSMQTDAAHGRPLELDAISGAILRRASVLGIEVPVTATLHHLLAGLYGAA